MTNYDAYIHAVEEICAAAEPHNISPAAAPEVMGKDADALKAAVAHDPRDQDAIRQRVVRMAADALRVITAMGEAGELQGAYVTPTPGRLPAMIDEFAPNTANTWIGQDDPVRRFADELLGAINRYREPEAGSVYDSSYERARWLFRVVGLSAHAIAGN